MNAALKVFSTLLTYPTADIQAAAGEMSEALDREPSIPAAAREQLHDLITEIASGDIYDLQERYVSLFDRTRSLSLHLFEHVHGESRDRGQAMIDLKNLYESGGLHIAATELPDYLPLFLEFLSTRPRPEARDLLGQTGHIVGALGDRLTQKQSAYAGVFGALAGMTDAAEIEREEAVEALDPDDLTALDAEWEEAPVTFGPESGDGCKDGLIARLRAAKRPAAQQS
jgi:nitrate reductase delta subunit